MFRTFPRLIVSVALLVGMLAWAAGVEAQSAPTICGGNAVKKVALRAQHEPAFLPADGTLIQPEGAEIAYNVVSGTGPDMFLVTFSAECQLTKPPSGPGEFVGVRVTVDGVDMDPSPVRFCSSDTPATYSATFCRPRDLWAGVHTVRVYGEVVNPSQVPDLNGNLAAWTLMLQVSE